MSDLTARMAPSVATFDAAAWDALLPPGRNPFVSHAFLTALEDSGSVGEGSGWLPAPLVIERDGTLLGAMPAYLKGHSQGEYVFDHSWADAYARAGGRYYPKLQIAAPFTPATGPRLLLADETLAPSMLQTAQTFCEQNSLSSAHATFIEPAQQSLFEEAGWLMRDDLQFHWRNRNFASFDDFLGTLASRKRRTLRKERAKAQDTVTIRRLRGDDIKPEHWDAFWIFYQDTGARKWGSPYLTRAAFELFQQRMGDDLLLILAFVDDVPVAGALNFYGGDALYGRYWGCTQDIPFLHFELCYYQAIDAAIEAGLARVEAGAQGSHKLARGYEPVTTRSAHYIPDPGFREAVADFLERERSGVAMESEILSERTPFRKG